MSCCLPKLANPQEDRRGPAWFQHCHRGGRPLLMPLLAERLHKEEDPRTNARRRTSTSLVTRFYLIGLRSDRLSPRTDHADLSLQSEQASGRSSLAIISSSLAIIHRARSPARMPRANVFRYSPSLRSTTRRLRGAHTTFCPAIQQSRHVNWASIDS